MKKMKRAIAALAALAVLTCGAAAYRVPHIGGMWDRNVVTDGVNGNDLDQVDMLRKLGLWQGKGERGDALYDPLTRAEGAALLVRFLGGEKEAITGTYGTPFTDVSGWAAPYIGWLYQNGFAKGVSDTRYGVDEELTAVQFSLFLSRAICGTDDMAGTVLTEMERSQIDGSEDGLTGNGFIRMTAVGLMTRALKMAGPDGQTLAQALVKRGVFTSAQFDEAAWGIFQPDYGYDAAGHITCSIAGVPVCISEENGLTLDRIAATANIPYLLAYRQDGEKTVLFRLDPHTLAASQASATPLGEGAWADDAYLLTLGGRDYFRAPSGALYCLDSGECKEAVDSTAMAGATLAPLTTGHGSEETGVRLIITAATGILVFTPDSTTPQKLAVAGEILYQDTSCLVVREHEAAGDALCGIDMQSGQEADRYPVPQDAVFYVDQPWIFGEAGLYEVTMSYNAETEVSRSRLTRHTVRPALAVQTVRWGAGPSDPYILTHADGQAGAAQLAIVSDGECRVLCDLQKSGLSDTVFAESWDSILVLQARNGADSGMFTYTALDGGGTFELNAVEFTPDQGSLTSAQQQEILKRERTRLRELGLSYWV